MTPATLERIETVKTFIMLSVLVHGAAMLAVYYLR
jgi:hypothetical protein